MSVRRSLFVLTLLTLALPLVIFANQATRSQSGAATLQTYTVGRGDVEVTVSAIGTVKADRSADLSFTMPGRIVNIPVQIGDTVAAGDLLAQQEDEVQRIALQQSQLALQAAQLQKAKLLAGPDNAQIAVAQANVNSAMGAVSSIQNTVSPDDLKAAQLAYDQAQQALTDAQHNRAFGSGTPSQVALLDAKVGEASFNAEVARLNLESLKNGNSAQLNAAYARVTQVQRELERLKAGATQAQIDQADAAVARAQIGVSRAQTAVDQTRLTAPFGGIITDVSSEVGTLVVPGFTVIKIADVEPLRLVVQVDEIDVRQIAVGMPAKVRLDALPNVELKATLEDIALVPNNDNGVVSYDVTVRLDDSDPRVRVGMTAEALAVVQSKQNVITVPNQYIRLDRQHNQAYVNVVQANNQLKEIPMTLGLQGQDTSEITAGLKVGDVIGVDLSADRINLFGG